MTLIKNTHADRVLKDAVVLDLGDLRRQAEQIIDEAKTEAAEILDRGRAEAQRLVDEAAEKGRVQGVEEGIARGVEQGREQALQEFRERLQQLSAHWTQAVEDWERQRCEFFLEAHEDVLEFALLAAKKIVHSVAARDPEVVRDQLATTLSLLSRPSAVTIRIHPENRALVEAALPAIMTMVGNCEHASLEDDESITPGGCVVRTRGGSIDATIEAQLDRIVETLLSRSDAPPPTPSEEAAEAPAPPPIEPGSDETA